MNWTMIFAGLLGLFCVGVVGAEQKSVGHRVIFEFVSDDPQHHEALLNNVENVLKALGPETEIEVVAHGPGLSLLQKPHQTVITRMRKLAGPRIVFAACENTLRRKNLKKADLLPFATTVDSGVAEVVRKQEAGWSYIKSGG